MLQSLASGAIPRAHAVATVTVVFEAFAPAIARTTTTVFGSTLSVNRLGAECNCRSRYRCEHERVEDLLSHNASGLEIDTYNFVRIVAALVDIRGVATSQLDAVHWDEGCLTSAYDD